MAAPRIAITTSGLRRVQLNAAYLHAVQQAGGLPFVVATLPGPEAALTTLAECDALLLTGGGDVAPERYGEARHPAVDGVAAERDAVEAALIDAALDRRMPVLAICRGMQMLNVALGGTLVQDVPSEIPGALQHPNPETCTEPVHDVSVEAGSRLAGIVGEGRLAVNSRHHQSVARPGAGLRVVAEAPDGVAEAAELDDPQRWVIAVQWHPEDLVDAHAHAHALFAELVRQAR
jgi:putative glutamine amidotransferase